jgi:hypothetical protein
VDVARARRRPLRGSRINDSDYFPFEGGLNLVDTPLKLKPGQLLASKNYEPGIRGGYRSIIGYERLDGRTEPSQAQYWQLDYDGATRVPVVGSVINQANGANAVVLAVAESQPVTIVNLFTLSEDFSVSAGWTATHAEVVSNVAPAPVADRSTVDFLREDTDLTEHSITRTLAKAAGAQMYWLTFYAHAQGRTRGQIEVSSIASPGNLCEVKYDLLNRAINAATHTADFTALDEYLLDIGGGWYRVGIKFISTSEAQLGITLRLADSGSSTTYRGDGVSGVQFFGMQLEVTTAEAVFPSDYVVTDSQARGNGFGHYALGRLSGDFEEDADLRVGPDIYAVAAGDEVADSAATDELDQAYSQLAIADARAQIGKVPGAGRILGVVVYNGTTYAMRNTIEGTAANMYRATPQGWQQVQLGYKLRFTAGLAAAIAEGDTVAGVTSGATGVVRRVVVQTGTFAGNNAAGYLIVPTITGTFQDGETLAVSSTNRATASGSPIQQTFGPNGVFEFRVHNFYGHTGQRRLYGVDGVGRAFEYQDAPEFFLAIETGMAVDAPNHLGVHQSQLWLMFPGGSVQKSAVGTPSSWSVSLGAAEMGIGDEGTGFLEEIGDTLFVFARNSSYYVAGTAAAYELKPFNREVGAMPGSIQRIGKGVYLDDRGVSTLGATQAYGNYAYNSVSALIQPLIKQLKRKVTTSVTVKDDNLYRLFFNDGRFISVGFQDKKISGFTSCEYPLVVRCAFAGEDSLGEQMIVFGSDDGYVYRAERGTSFDGLPIETFMRPVYFFSRTPSRRKRYRRAQLDVRVTGDLLLSVSVDYSFGDADDPAEAVREIQLGGGGGFYGSVIWGEFKWGAGSAPEAIMKLEGSGINIGFLIASTSTTASPHSLEGVNLHHSTRRINRGTSYA